MIVPEFFDKNQNHTEHDGGRRLMAMNQIDVQRDILDLKFLLKSDEDPESI